MAAPLAVLRNGILNGSWDEVVEGFALLTGERLGVPKAQALPLDINAHGVIGDIYDLLDKYYSGYKIPQELEPINIKEEFKDLRKEIEATQSESRHETMEWDKEEPAKPITISERSELDFSIEHKGTEEQDYDPEKGRRARTLPMDTSSTTENRFKADPRLASEEAQESIALSEKFKGKSHRQQYVPIKVKCKKCGNEEFVHPDNAPKHSDSSDEGNSYVCNTCIKK